jgi:acetylornithine/N-succinyldiaminopimelate aminotransferase
MFSNVRGDGLLLGCELSEKWQDRARDILTKCTEQGLLVLMAGPNVIRLAPPLIISDADIIAGIEVMDRAISAL